MPPVPEGPRRTDGPTVVGGIRHNLAKQREYYGEPLGDRARRLVVAFGITQARLAEVLGISAPMLSQVMSGRRQRIGNPAAVARLQMLERKILLPEVAAGRRDAMDAALDDVQDSEPTVPAADARALVAGLRAHVPPADLARAAQLLEQPVPGLARLLAAAARRPR